MGTFARLPARPLQRELRLRRRVLGMTWAELAVWLGVSERTLSRLLHARDLAEPVADRMACRLGFHPLVLWPRLWLQEGDRRDRTAS